jgi:thioredoxin-related protein
MHRRTFTTLAGLSLLAPALPARAAITMGDDGLHKAAWQHDTFKDLREDLAEANAQGKRFMAIVEQRGCVYCKKMYEETFPDPKIDALLNDKFFVIQLNMFGDIETTDFDGQVSTEKKMVRKWRLMFTPTMIFFPEEVPDGETGIDAAVAVMPGAFGKQTTFDMLNWVLAKGYDGNQSFQEYHRSLEEVKGTSD